ENTERPITTTRGTNRIVGVEPAAIFAAWRDVAGGRGPAWGGPGAWGGEGVAGMRAPRAMGRQGGRADRPRPAPRSNSLTSRSMGDRMEIRDLVEDAPEWDSFFRDRD